MSLRCAHLYSTAAFLSLVITPSLATTSPSLTSLYLFSGGATNSGEPNGAVAQDASGALYGFTGQGGVTSCFPGNTAGCGTMFKLTPPKTGQSNWIYSLLWDFPASKMDGYFYYGTSGTPIFDSNGNIYGSAPAGGVNNPANCSPAGVPGCGVIFELSPPAQGKTKWTETILWDFTGGADGSAPQPGLARDSSGALYGETQVGGANGTGTVFKVQPPAAGKTAWTETTLYNFLPTDVDPVGTPLLDASGDIFGLVSSGGTGSSGTVYELTPPAAGSTKWKRRTIYNVGGGAKGNVPWGGLVFGSAGELYGTANNGGSNANLGGTVFELVPRKNGTYVPKILWNFGTNDGKSPQGPLLIDKSGAIFGTTEAVVYSPEKGFTPPYGAVWKLAKVAGKAKWSRTVIWPFTSGSDGAYPGPLFVDSNGTLYGMTAGGGNPAPNEWGVVFSVTGSGFKP
jgi:hypothetical protein